jgi:HEAT repeat protein
LVQALKDPEKSVRDAAAMALRAIDKEALPADLREPGGKR